MESTHAGESWFSWVDYTTFTVLVAFSCAGGFWYGALGTRAQAIPDVGDYLLGGRTLATFPVALSLIASYVSGVTMLGMPAEIYNYGAQYWLILVAIPLSGVVVSIVYLPVFCTLRLTSSYEYLEIRFNRHVRAVASLLFIFDEVLFLPMIVYIPALAFYRMTGVNVHLVGAVMVVVCGLYTVLGGLRAVVWTDAWQTAIMFLGAAVVAIVGTYQVGGIGQVLKFASQGGRLQLWNWDPNPFVRQTAWGSLVGGFIYWTAFNSVNQTMVQRYMSLPTKKEAVIAIAMFCVGSAGVVGICLWCGLVAFGNWMGGGCSPVGAPPVDDGMLPAYVMQITYKASFYGMSGVFLAGVFGAGLSSLSVVLNACSLVAVEDGARGWAGLSLQPRTEGLLARGVAAILSLTTLGMLLVVEKLGGVLGVATALSAIASSATCGVFTLGMLIPWAGSRGAIAGATAGALLTGTVALGSQAATAQGLVQPLPQLGSECRLNASITEITTTLDPESIFPLFRLSFHWVAPLGLVATVLVGAVSSAVMDNKILEGLDPELLSPVVHKFLPNKVFDNVGIARRRTRERNEASSPPSN